MSYFSSSGDCQCKGRCGGCGCSSKPLGQPGLAEWYERDDEPEQPTGNGVSRALGEPLPPMPRLVLQTPSLLQPDPTPPLLRRMQGTLLPGQLTLQPQFQPMPGGTVPPVRPPDLFRLSPEFQRQLIEKWERERRNRELFTPIPPAPPRPSLSEAIDRYINATLNRLMGDIGVPPDLRGPIRLAVRTAIGRGSMEALDQWLRQTRLSGPVREAIKGSVRGAMKQIGISPLLEFRF